MNQGMKQGNGSLQGKLLLAMPGMGDPRFYKATVFICTHDENGAMGLIINQVMPNISLGDFFEQLSCEIKMPEAAGTPVLNGGPVDTERGFLLHTRDYSSPETIIVNEKFGVSATIEALESFARGNGPKDMIFALGYAGWDSGQLEQELLDNAWLIVDANYELVFNTDVQERWDRAMFLHGIDPSRLSTSAGHA